MLKAIARDAVLHKTEPTAPTQKRVSGNASLYVEVIDLYWFFTAQILINLSQHRSGAALRPLNTQFSTKLSTVFVKFRGFCPGSVAGQYAHLR